MVQLGCDKNTVDGERILGELDAGGFSVVHPDARKQLGLLIINTCSFIGPARQESIREIKKAAKLKEKGAVRRIAVAGCFAPLIENRLDAALRSQIDFFISPGDIPKTREIVAGEEEAHFRPPARSMDPGPRLLASGNITAFVRIAEGCNKTCSFCTIPSIRGKFVSRPMDLILDEISALVEVGVREVVLVSQDTAHYGLDAGGTLTALVRRIGALDLPYFRLRIHYLYPSQVKDDFIDAVAENKYAVPYFDIPIQHASPLVLKAMRRPHDPDQMRRLVARIRSTFDETAIRTTVITGHPGETADEFKRLLDFVEEMAFDRLGVFPFSAEPGTRAHGLPRPRGARARAEEVIAVQEKISAGRLKKRVGREYDVLMDTAGEGRSAFEAPDVDGVIYLGAPAGEIVRARITKSDVHDLHAAVL